MTVKFLKETAATADDVTVRGLDEGASTEHPEARPIAARPGLLVAGFLIMAALTSGSSAPIIPFDSYLGRRRHETTSESGTAENECDPELVARIREIFEQGRSEFFQDGMYSAFSRALVATFAQHGRSAFHAVAEYLFSRDASPNVLSEALRWLADFKDPATLRDRWAILERTLRDRSPLVRDGAILGFAALDDPRARSLLFEAQKAEPIVELRRTLDQVIQQLNATANAAAAPHSPPEQVA